MQTKRKSRIVSLRSSFMDPKLLVFAVVLAILFVAIGSSMSSTQGMEDVYEQWFQERKGTRRPSFFVVPAPGQTGDLPWLLLDFYKMYPEARMPEEFLPVSYEGEGTFEGYELPSSEESLFSSVLLTMAYQQGYKIEAVTDTYIILVKSVNIEIGEKRENDAESDGSD